MCGKGLEHLSKSGCVLNSDTDLSLILNYNLYKFTFLI